MPMQADKIRVLALALVEHDGKLLVSPGIDKVRGEDFYRLPGGGVDFGETALEALKREFMEEFRAEIVQVKLLSVFENIFEFNGDKGHEVTFIFSAKFKDESLYDQSSFKIIDSHREGEALWVPISKLKESRLYPLVAKECL